jgi:hypothetical protein
MPELDRQTERPATGKFLFASGAQPLPGYTIKRGIGRGGFGEVYYAISDAGKEVALKLIRRNLDVELRGVTQCLNLKHPHLLALFDVRHDAEDNCWVIMEHIAGPSLELALDRAPNGLPRDQALAWMHGIATGVAYLHHHGIVHRDLKPGNIFNDDGVVKLGDYGLSKFISCSRRSGQTESVGTVHYMAPEIANGRYGREIDLYALGIILYEMLTGHVPFEGESVGEVLMKHLTADPDLSQLDEPFRTIVARSLAKDPAQRYASVEEMIAALPALPARAGFSSSGAVPQHPVGRLPASPAANMSDASVVLTDEVAFGSSAATSPAVGQVPEDPVWRWLRGTLHDLKIAWRQTKLAAPIKAVLVIIIVVLLARNATRILPLLIWATVAYLIYRLIRGIWYQSQRLAAVTSESGNAAPGDTPQRARHRAVQWPTRTWAGKQAATETPSKALPAEAASPKWSQASLASLLGSLLASSAVAAVVALVMVLLRGQPPEAEQYLWVALVGALGAWAVLIPAKIWEHETAEPALRRFAMLVVGLLVGSVAYGLSQWLLVDLPFDIPIRPVDEKHIPKSFYSQTDGSPLMYAYLAYFGFLFLLVRWWRGADPLRPTRLSLLGTSSALFVAWLLNFVWPFPQPWGLMATATISIAVQLASPWKPPKKPAFRTANNL